MAIADLQAAVLATEREQMLIARRSGYAADVSDLPDKLGAMTAAATVFSEHEIAFALIGGLAVGIRTGVPRATLDVDFAVPTSVDRAWVTECFVKRGFLLKGEFAHSVNFQHESGEPVQLAFDPLFDPMIARAEATRFGDLELYVVLKDEDRK